jgi:hypothetical protein
VYKTENREIMVCVPEMKQEPRKQIVTTYKHVEETVVRKVCTYECRPVQVTCCDPCGNPCVRTCYERVAVWTDVPCKVMRCIPVPKEVTVMVNVCTYRTEKKIVPVQVCHFETKVEKYTCLVPLVKQRVEDYKVLVCTYVPSVEKYKCLVCSYEMQSVKKKVQVTTYKCEASVVTEKVPVSTCGYYRHGCCY